jgi:Cytochrome P450
VNQEENRAVPCIATSTITELSEDSTPEAILMAKALPSTVYLGTILRFILELRVLRLPVSVSGLRNCTHESLWTDFVLSSFVSQRLAFNRSCLPWSSTRRYKDVLKKRSTRLWATATFLTSGMKTLYRMSRPCSTRCLGGALQAHWVSITITFNIALAMCSWGGLYTRHPSSPDRRRHLRWLLYSRWFPCLPKHLVCSTLPLLSCASHTVIPPPPPGRAIMHDPTTYPEPTKFKPERFLDPVTPAPLPDAAFGFGRRVCPGQFFARDMLWVAMASMLAVFEFLPATDAEGRPIPPAQEFTSLFAS